MYVLIKSIEGDNRCIFVLCLFYESDAESKVVGQYKRLKLGGGHVYGSSSV
jgi:hypothetical protein